MQATANARQNCAQEWEGFRTVAGYSGKWLTLFCRMDYLSAIVLTNFQLVVFSRETVLLIAIWQLAGESREVILNAVAPIGLIPGEHFAHRLYR